MDNAKNIIIGAGISGLSCGWALGDCLLAEKDPAVGGLCKTINFKGFRFDLGGHRLFTKNELTEKFVRNILPGELLEKQRFSSIYKNKRLITYPLGISVMQNLNPFDIVACFFTYVLRKLHPLSENSFEESTKNSFGDRLFDLFFKDYTEKMWGLGCQELSKELAQTRLQLPSLKRVILHALSPNRRNMAKLTDKILYPKMGIGTITDRLSRNLDIKLNSTVTGLICSDNRIKRVVLNGSEELPCKNVISTMPVTKLIEMLNSPKEIRDISGRLQYRSIILVFLALHKNRYCDDHWIYFPGKQIFGRLHEPKNWSEHMAPKDKTGICLEVFCSNKDALWHMPDAEIAHQTIKELPFLNESEVIDSFVKRVGDAYPVYNVGYKDNINKINKFLLAYKNLSLLGRAGTFRYINMDTCIEDGLRLGRFLQRCDGKHLEDTKEMLSFNKQ